MLEQDLIDLFEQQASEGRPPAHASIAAAAHVGRIQRRRRRAVSIAAPVLAGATVLAIAVSGTLAASAPARPTSGQALRGQRHEVPVLYFWPGWLPPGLTVLSGVVSAPHAESLVVGGNNQFWDAAAYSAGACTVKRAKLFCPQGGGYPIDGTAGSINGFAAYWSGGRRLVFERARDQWATVAFPTHADDLGVARHLITRGPAIRYPAQLTGAWPGVGVQWAGFSYTHGRAVVDQYSLGKGAASERNPLNNTAQIGQNPAGPKRICGKGRDEVLNGFQVVTWRSRGTAPTQSVCAYNARGLSVGVLTTGRRPFSPATGVFTHLRFFGPDPANWTTSPIV